MDFFEKLPQNCPPAKAKMPNNEICYRLVKGFPPSIEDFYSQRKLYPNRNFNVNECIARAVSLQRTSWACEQIKKFPIHKNKIVVKITLDESSGMILKTSRSHYSWWMSLGFNAVEKSELV